MRLNPRRRYLPSFLPRSLATSKESLESLPGETRWAIHRVRWDLGQEMIQNRNMLNAYRTSRGSHFRDVGSIVVTTFAKYMATKKS
eukprot:108344-Amphidinium_carterae.1